MEKTPLSLLERLRLPGERTAWDRFVALYTPLLYHWTRCLGLQEPDASDLVQDVFVILLQEMPRFTYEPPYRFRGWLWTVLVNRHRERRRQRAGRATEVGDDALAEQPGPDSTLPMEEAEYRQYLVQRALQLMQTDFQPTTWKACWEYVVVGRPAAEVAAELQITVNAVHLARARVLRRLHQDLAGLLD